MTPLRGDPGGLNDLILDLETKEIFDKNNFSETDRRALDYLCDLNSFYEIIAPTNPDSKQTACIFDCLPGSLPTKYGFTYKNEAYNRLENALVRLFLKNGITEVWTDMSQGFSIAAANAVIKMKRHGYDISLKLAIPYKGHADQVYGASKVMYDFIISKADAVILISELPKNKESFKNGLCYIIDQSNTAICCNVRAKNNTFFLNYCKQKKVRLIDFDLDTLGERNNKPT